MPDAGLDAHDLQPVVPILEVAGGTISDWQSKPCYDGGSILACGDAALHERLLRLIA